MSSLPSPSTILSLQLEKPLGLILEEADDHSSSTTGGGVIVTQVNEGGSAYNSPNSALLPTSKVIKVNGRDVSNMSFDDVMDVIVDANSPLDIQFALMDVPTTETSSSSSSSSSGGAVQSNTVTAATTEEVQVVPQYEIGTIVSIRVEQPDNNKPPITLQARVGDNLRKTLLSNKDIELYRGLKKKLGNCGGGGQCGYCAVELVDDDDVNNTAWGKRSDYEDMKIGKKVGTERYRLACMNNIVGPATVRTL
jgi:ferredoxin